MSDPQGRSIQEGLKKNKSRSRCLIQVHVADLQYFIFSADSDVAKYIKFNAGTVGQVHARIVIGGIAIGIPGMGTDNAENAHSVSQRKAEMGTGLDRLAVEIQILVLELAEIDERAFERQIVVEAITCKNLITGVFIVQMDFVGFNAADAGAKI